MYNVTMYGQMKVTYPYNWCCFVVRKEAPEFVKSPEDVEVMEQEDVTFEATVTAKPRPQVEW